MFEKNDIRHFLQLCLNEAEVVLEGGNYPIGSLVVNQKGKILSQERNQFTTLNDVTAHPEILNLRKIGMLSLKNNEKHTLFSSLEPCFGCSFFIDRSNITRIYAALKDPHKGGMSDLKAQKMFSAFFDDIELINEPFDDLKEQSMKLMKEYFLRIGRADKASHYRHSSK